MKRDILAIMFCSSLLGACQINVPPCGRNEERVIHTMCSCSDEHKQDRGHACCRRDGGVCEDEQLIPPPRTSWPPSTGPLLGVWDFAVHPGELVNGNQLVPSANAVMPYICQPMFAKWSYVNLANGPLASSSDIGVFPRFVFARINEEEDPIVDVPVPFSTIPFQGSVPMLVPILGQDEETFYYADIDPLPALTPGDHYLSVEVRGRSDTWDEFEFDYCE